MDWILRNATVVDGSGGPARAATVGIDGDRIAAVGDLPEHPEAREVDLEGLVLAPGFVDVHTHYDAQNLWDDDLTSSFWHGVTTVVMGNCGFGVAPIRPELRSLITRTLEIVEGMPAEALDAGIPWEFESFDEYLALVAKRPKRLNMGALIGHTPLRLFVMGEEATERSATPEEVDRMRGLLADAIGAGALGFATSKNPAHNGAWGRPVPSRVADPEEIEALAGVLGDLGKGVMEATYGPTLMMSDLARISERTGQPVTWAALLTSLNQYGANFSGMEELASRSTLEVLDYQAGLPGEVWPQIACRPLVSQMSLAAPGSSLARLPTFKEIMALPRDRRAALVGSADWRGRARPEVDAVWTSVRWAKFSIDESEHHAELRGIPFDRLAEEQGVHPFDLMVDLSLEDGLNTRFRIVALNDDEDELALLLRDGRALLGLSDAGAHVGQLYDACYSTHLLGHWVREKAALPLEQAVWRLTSHPAQVFRIPDRGLVREGYKADLVAFDAATVAPGRPERVRDLPGGAERLIAPSLGIEHMWVNGVLAHERGADVPGAHAGELLTS